MQELLEQLNHFQKIFIVTEKYSETYWTVSRVIDSLVRKLETRHNFSAVLNPRTNIWS